MMFIWCLYGLPMVLGNFNLAQGHAEKTVGVFIAESVDLLKTQIINEAPSEYRQLDSSLVKLSSQQSEEDKAFTKFLLNENEEFDWEVRQFLESEFDVETKTTKDAITGEN